MKKLIVSLTKGFIVLFCLWFLAGTPRVSYSCGTFWYCRYPNLLEVIGLKDLPTTKVIDLRQFSSPKVVTVPVSYRR